MQSLGLFGHYAGAARKLPTGRCEPCALIRRADVLGCWPAVPPPALHLAAQSSPFLAKRPAHRGRLARGRRSQLWMAAAVRRACGGAALSGAAAFLVARLADGPKFVDSSAISDKPPSLTKTHNLLGRQVVVSLPSSYVEDVRARRSFDVVYVLDSSADLFAQIANAARSDHDSVHGLPDRQWYPKLIIAGVCSSLPHSSDALIEFVEDWVVPMVDASYSTKPYAAGRALCAYGPQGGAALRKLLLDEDHRKRLFRFYLLGAAGLEGDGVDESVAGEMCAPLPDKTSVFLSGAGGDAATGVGSQLEATRNLARVLNERTKNKMTDTTMFVDRHGVQHYTQHAASLGAPVTIDLVEGRSASEGGALAAAFASRGMHWLGERLERQKHASLGSLLPWHEFK